MTRSSRPFVALVLAAAVAACGSNSSPTQPSPAGHNPQTYLQVLIDIMEANSVHRLRINWADFRGQVMAAGASAVTVADTFPAIRTALTLLGDGHSGYLPATGTNGIFVGTRTCTAPAVAAPDVPPDVGYVRVTSFSGTSAEALAFADNVQNTIRAADRDGLAGWIVDLRGNGGGNMWPMIAGLGPIAGEGLLGYFAPPVGVDSPWGYREGASWSGPSQSTAQTVTSAYRLRKPNPRVAVLIDKRVASSGEAATIAFKQRGATRFFGSATCGLSTANRLFDLTDGAKLNLTVSTMADRTRKEYGDVVEPDEVIADPEEVVARAIAWLRGQ